VASDSFEVERALTVCLYTTTSAVRHTFPPQDNFTFTFCECRKVETQAASREKFSGFFVKTIDSGIYFASNKILGGKFSQNNKAESPADSKSAPLRREREF